MSAEMSRAIHREVAAAVARRAGELQATQPGLAAELSVFAYLHACAARRLSPRPQPERRIDS